MTTQSIPHQRPIALPVIPENVPDALCELAHWVGWRYQWVQARSEFTKVPKNARTGVNASSTKADDWCSFEEALAGMARFRFDGIGFCFDVGRADVLGVDFDKCRNPMTGEIAPSVRAWLRRLDTYAEVSPSGTGIKIFGRGHWPDHGRKCIAPDVVVEVYATGRYFTVTGHRLDGADHDPQ